MESVIHLSVGKYGKWKIRVHILDIILKMIEYLETLIKWKIWDMRAVGKSYEDLVPTFMRNIWIS